MYRGLTAPVHYLPLALHGIKPTRYTDSLSSLRIQNICEILHIKAFFFGEENKNAKMKRLT